MEENKYDGVFCIGVKSKEQIKLRPGFKEFRRTTKAGGIAVFTVRHEKLVDITSAFGEVMRERKMKLVSMETTAYSANANRRGKQQLPQTQHNETTSSCSS